MRLSASVIYAGITLVRAASDYCEGISDSLERIRNGPATKSGYDYEEALRAGEEFGWGIFSPSKDDPVAFRETLRSLVSEEKSAWTRYIPFGREVLRKNLEIDERQCFEIAGLFSEHDETVVSWWDECSALVRSSADSSKIDVGRRGERLSFQRELDFCEPHGLDPVWVALDDNTVGFDVRSWRPGKEGWADPIPIYIEVKSSEHSRRVFLSRNEWNFAMRHRDSWQLDFWNLGDQRCTQYQISDVEPHVPVNYGSGRWESSSIQLPEEPNV
jgi:hypothetical protein